MKVYIGPYKNWIGPYQLADMIPFISEDTSFRIGTWLSKTWVNDVCEWYYPKIQRKIKVRIDKYDTWNMNDTLAHIILPMLKQLKATKHGVPGTIVADVGGEDHSEQDSFDFYKESHSEAFDKACLRWDEILDKMISS